MALSSKRQDPAQSRAEASRGNRCLTPMEEGIGSQLVSAMRQFMRTLKTVGLFCISLFVMAGPMAANDKSPNEVPVVVPQPSPGVASAPMNAEQEALARRVLQDEMSNPNSAVNEVTIRTFGDALARDFLGRRGRDMFDIGGSLRVRPPVSRSL